MTNEQCHRLHGLHTDYEHLFYEGTLCAFAQEEQGVCEKDFGGPLTANGQLIGLAQWTIRCAYGLPDGYLRISVFLDWIREVSGAVAV